MARKKTNETKRPNELYEHRVKQRVNNLLEGLATPKTKPDAGEKKKNDEYDPHPNPLPGSDPHPDPLPVGEGGRRPGEGIKKVWNGLKRKIAPQVALKSFVNNPEIDGIHACMPPAIDQALADLTPPSPRGRGRREMSAEGKKALDPEFLAFVRQLRRDRTDAESLLWSLLRNRRFMGCKFRRQHPVKPYVVDFYCHEARLAIELDGGQHNEPDARAREEQRTTFLEARGIRVLRFWNNEVFNDLDGVLQAIYDALTHAPSPSGRGPG